MVFGSDKTTFVLSEDPHYGNCIHQHHRQSFLHSSYNSCSTIHILDIIKIHSKYVDLRYHFHLKRTCSKERMWSTTSRLLGTLILFRSICNFFSMLLALLAAATINASLIDALHNARMSFKNTGTPTHPKKCGRN